MANSKNPEVVTIRVTLELASECRVRQLFRAMCRRGSWSGSWRSRAGESTTKSAFERKALWKTFFHVLAGRSQTHCFYSELSPSRRPSFHNFDFQLANSTSGHRGASGIQLGPKLTQSRSDSNPRDPLGSNIIFTSPADVTV